MSSDKIRQDQKVQRNSSVLFEYISLLYLHSQTEFFYCRIAAELKYIYERTKKYGRDTIQNFS